MKSSGIFKIVSNKRSWYERVLAAVFYSSVFYIIYKFYSNVPVSFSEAYFIISLKILASLIIIIGFGIKFSFTVNHHFDFDFRRYRTYYSVGPFGRGKWEPIDTLNRVSTFLNNRNQCEVTVWDVKNNRYKISVFNKIEDAVNFGRKLAKNLELEFIERK